MTGVTTSLDMAFPDPSSEGGRANWRAILRVVLPYVDIFMPSVEETLFMLRREVYERLTNQSEGGDILDAVTPDLLTDLSEELLDLGAKIVLLKLGCRGAYLRTANVITLRDFGRAVPKNLEDWNGQELWAPCFQVDVVGTTGSGDATIAGFLSVFLRGLYPHEALTLGVAVGACNVEKLDALSGLRSWEGTLQRVDRGWSRCPLDLSQYGWVPDKRYALWARR